MPASRRTPFAPVLTRTPIIRSLPDREIEIPKGVDRSTSRDRPDEGRTATESAVRAIELGRVLVEARKRLRRERWTAGT
jgi:hypothetical protein